MALINCNHTELGCFSGKNIEISNELYKCGDSSLRWEHSKGDTLCISTPVDFTFNKDAGNPQAELAFAMYVGTKSSCDGKFTVIFQKDGDNCCQFDFNGGFTGWRYLRILFEDMDGQPMLDMNSIKIVADSDGVLYLNEIVTANYCDVRLTTPSYQLPNIKSKYTNGVMAKGVLKPEYKSVHYDDSVILKRLQEYVVCEYGKNIDIEEARKKFISINIKEIEDGVFQGNKVESESQRAMVKNTLGENVVYITLRTCTDLARDLAILYDKTEDEYYKKSYILLLKYLIFCGIAGGSAVGEHHLLDYSLKPLYMSIAVMYSEITESELANSVQKLCQWFTHINKRGMLLGQKMAIGTADDFNNASLGMLLSACFIKDNESRSRWLFAIKSWIEFNMQFTNNLMGIYKSDGCIYHHCGHYPAYGMCGLNGVIPVVYSLSGTPYEICGTAWNNTKKVMSTMRFYGCKYDVPIAFTARHPTGIWQIDVIPFKYLALAGMLRGDRQVVAMYLRLLKDEPDVLDEKLLALNIEKEPTPTGNISLPMACSMLHRRGEWLVVMKGFSKYLWGNETYKTANLYGRYRSYGNIEIVENSLKDSGFEHNGYDFRRMSGITSIIPPLDEFKQDVKNLDKDSGFEEMLISDQAFAGGVSDGRNGMFSMILTEHPKYNGTHFAIKTGIFVDNFALLFGSNIKNVSKYPTETTLFQNYIGEDNVSDDFVDVLGNVYHTKDEGAYVTVGEQVSQSSTGSGETRGRFKRCGISHGVSPSGGKYEYSICMKGAKPKAYKIVQQDDVAHIAVVNGITFMAIYKPEQFKGYEDVKSVDIPALIMIDKIGNVRICNPDLGLYDVDDDTYDDEGKRFEVSVYSRKWITKDIQSKNCKLTLAHGVINIVLKGGQTYSAYTKQK